MRRAAFFAACVLLAAPASALAASCTVTATALSFGIYKPISGSYKNSSGTINVKCTSFTGTMTIALSAGLNSGGNFSNRRMNAGGNYLGYQLYTNSARTMVWGDGTGGTSVVSKTCSGSCTRTPTVYGQIPASQTTAVPGVYSDTTTVTVTY